MADKKLGEARTQFVEKVNKAVISKVLDDLLEKGVLNDEEVEKVKEKSVTQEQARTLIDGVRKKGPRASLIAIKSIHARDVFLAEQLGLTVFLEGSPSQPLQALGPRAILSVEETQPVKSRQGTTLCPPNAFEETQPVESRQGIKLCPPNVFDKIQKEESTKIYPIRDLKRRTRLALIICNIDFESACFSRRDGAEVDKAGMERLLTGLGYKVESHTNLCSEEMADRLRKFAARKEHEASDSTFVVLMSHGLRAGLCGVKSQGENSDILSHDTIYSILNNKNCPALRDKPKVIIIQACRGENKGVIYVSCTDTPSADSLSPAPELPEKYESDALRRVHVESDLICFCSTTPDNVSWRSPQTGSIFIVQLIKHMQEHAWRYHLEDIFREVQNAFNNNPLQMPTRERATLLKKFYLFPGH
ncbi:PREDICTED: caspase-1-like [Gekko japonicus]|uniref:Caspase-1-like n=1 Tax=Gekko japonicus TaxID=146911 RepID=A0ABM1K5P6_GEKJA|nr:PREDICTED: caspase-1-like [Gekko japonicus]